ncbi:MAG: UDP-N-acetylmuramoyl-L-alanine--D-glutamate ligase [Verrucomicrobiae bacterium]|nr:UDP-N-acetylmuramoyl-L-alanine--D-glutamate ligase [Verrucomicrobiae bacterium]
MDVKNKRILVAGFGASGEAAAQLLRLHGARVLVIDQAENETMKRRARRKKNTGIETRFGAAQAPREKFDAAIVSPGISLRQGLGRSVVDLDVPVYGELELGYWFCSCPIVAITGTNGKTTTTELIHRAIRGNRRKAEAAGNIGLPLSEAVMKSDRLDYLVVEASSFQLETIDLFRPSVSVMMNITPDHLDRYDGMDDYSRAKAALWKNQQASDVAVINAETGRRLKQLGCQPASGVLRYSLREETGAHLWYDGHALRGPVADVAGGNLRMEQTKLRGPHNAENVMAALLAAHGLKLDLAKAWRAICSYEPLAHRLQTVGSLRGVEYVNDSKATNVDAMEKAILSFRKPIVLIAGGKDKGFDFGSAAPTLREWVKACVLIGETRERIYDAWKDAAPCSFADSMEDAVQAASRLAEKGDVVLLSPACASFDMFKNYEERGEMFGRAVRALLDSSADSMNSTSPSTAGN